MGVKQLEEAIQMLDDVIMFIDTENPKAAIALIQQVQNVLRHGEKATREY